MRFGEAEVVRVIQDSQGSHVVELKAVCPISKCEGLNAVIGFWREAVPLRPRKSGALHHFKINPPSTLSFSPGDKIRVEFLHPGEQKFSRMEHSRFRSLRAPTPKAELDWVSFQG